MFFVLPCVDNYCKVDLRTVCKYWSWLLARSLPDGIPACAHLLKDKSRSGSWQSDIHFFFRSLFDASTHIRAAANETVMMMMMKMGWRWHGLRLQPTNDKKKTPNWVSHLNNPSTERKRELKPTMKSSSSCAAHKDYVDFNYPLFFLFPLSPAFDVPPQEVLTKDSVTVSVDAVVYYRVSDVEIIQNCKCSSSAQKEAQGMKLIIAPLLCSNQSWAVMWNVKR